MSTRAKLWLAGAMAVLVAAVTVAILLTAGGATRLGCIDTELAGAMGAEPLDECGLEARQTCFAVEESKAQYGTVGQIIVEKACRKGHLAIG